MDVNNSSSEKATMHWRLERVKCSDVHMDSVSTTRLDDVVSALVPLSLMGSPDFVKFLENPSIRKEYNDERLPQAHELCPKKSPGIEFSLSTRLERYNHLHRANSDIIATSRGPLIASMEDVAKEFRERNTGNMSSSEAYLKRAALRNFEEYKTRKGEIEDWTITEDSVRVRTTKYSSSVIAVAIAVIGGSFSVPFLVGESISGVDPFQFATFGWLLAGAFLIGAKSRYVENWDWHDFLRGQIVCRSVSELATASRVKPQAVLLYLLHHEFRQPLVFRGPYHGIFRRQAESGVKAFSVDVAVEHVTVLAAGFIVQEIRCTKEETKFYIQLHDTREDAYDNTEGKILLSHSNEKALGDKDEKQKSGYKKRIRLKCSEALSEDTEILGLPTTDCYFI